MIEATRGFGSDETQIHPTGGIMCPRRFVQIVLVAMIVGCGDGDTPVTPMYVARVSSMLTDKSGGVYQNWIGAWSGVTSGMEGERFGFLDASDNPNTPQVEQQYYEENYRQPAPSILSIGPSNGGPIPEQVLTITTDRGTLAVYMPKLEPNDCVRTRLYVAEDGSTYHSRSDHDYTYSVVRANILDGNCFGGPAVGPDLTPEQAMVPEHLARAAPR